MKKIFLLFFLFTMYAQSSLCKQISMNEAISVGLIQNPQLKAERAKIGISDAEIKEAGNFINPKVVLEATLADNSYKAGIEQTIELGGKRKKRVKAAKADKEIVVQKIAEEVINLRSKIKSAYIDLYIATERFNTANEIFNITEKLVVIAKKMESAGQIAMLDVLQAETVNIKAKNDIRIAELEKIQAFNTFNNLLGNSVESDVEVIKPDLKADFAEISTYSQNISNEDTVKTILETAYRNRPELKALEKDIEKNIYLEKLARATAIPDISISAGPNINVSKEEKTTTKVNLFAAVDMDLPIYNHGQAALKKVKAQKELLYKQIDSLKNDIQLEIQNVYSEIIQNEKSVKLYETELIPKSQDILYKSELSFKEGKSGILIPLNSQQAFIDIQKGYIDTLSGYYKSLNKLERAIGVNNEDI